MRILLLLFVLTGCASDRWLSKEEDAELRANCEPHGGCVAIPKPQWRMIEELIKRQSAI